ncbi:hypothetical protein HDV01_001680 [Terramyces sp. JEL0728]|nr:hypothetical protein HDV01_001680 [Terramyces sp. JEL0728]
MLADKSTQMDQEILDSLPLFKELDKKTTDQLLQLFKEKSFRKGDALYTIGSVHNEVFILKSGNVAICNNKKEKLKKLDNISAFGLTSLFIGQPTCSHTLIAETDVQVFYATLHEFETLASNNSNITSCILKYIASELRYWRDGPADYIPTKEKKVFMVFDAKSYDRKYFGLLEQKFADINYEVRYIESKLTRETVALAKQANIVCAFVNDELCKEVVARLHAFGVEMIAMRCAGFNNVDLKACDRVKLTVARVPAYSPYAVAEHAVALIMSLNRKIPQAYNKTRTGDFSLSTALTGFNIHGKTAGVIGTGKIGKILCGILIGFGCKIVCYDIYKDKELLANPNVRYVDDVGELYTVADIISLHSPLVSSTTHMINKESIGKMKTGVMLINTSRGGLIDTLDLIDGLKSGKIGYAGLDVYEGESEYFFENWTGQVIKDDLLSRLLSFSNVIVTSHQAFLTHEALENIGHTTFANVQEFAGGKKLDQLTNTCNNMK